MPSRDYEEFIAAFNAHGVRYLIIGAHALALHARPRATKDLDILVDPAPSNARKALGAVRDFFGGANLGYRAKDFSDPATIVQLGVAPVRIDVVSSVPGIDDFGAAWRKRVPGRFGSVEALYLGFDDLVHAKQAAGRLQDRADLRALQRAKASRTGSPQPNRRRISES